MLPLPTLWLIFLGIWVLQLVALAACWVELHDIHEHIHEHLGIEEKEGD